mgnify:CR=1 FL=1
MGESKKPFSEEILLTDVIEEAASENKGVKPKETRPTFISFEVKGVKYISLDRIPGSGHLICDGTKHYMKEGDNIRPLFPCDVPEHKKALQ